MTEWEISDLVLPGTTIPEIDGLETFLKTRGIKLLKETSNSVFTASDTAEDKEYTKELDAAEYITKPYDQANL